MGGKAHGEIESNTGQQEEREGGEGGEDVGNGLEEEERTIVEDLVKEWSNRLGPKYQVKVRLLTNFSTMLYTAYLLFFCGIILMDLT